MRKSLFLYLIILLFIFLNTGNIFAQDSPEDTFNNQPNSKNFANIENPTREQFQKIQDPTAQNLEKLGNKAGVDDFNKLDSTQKEQFITKNYNKNPKMFESYLRSDLGFANLGSISGEVKSFDGDTIEGQNGLRVSTFSKDIKFDIVNGNIVFEDGVGLNFASGGAQLELDSNGNGVLYVDRNSELVINSNKNSLSGKIVLTEGSKVTIPANMRVQLETGMGSQSYSFLSEKEVSVSLVSSLGTIDSFLNQNSNQNQVYLDYNGNLQASGKGIGIATNDNTLTRALFLRGENDKVAIIGEDVYLKGKDITYAVDESVPDEQSMDLFKEGNYFFYKTDENGNLIKADPRTYIKKFKFGGIRETLHYVKETGEIEDHKIKIGNMIDIQYSIQNNVISSSIDLETGEKVVAKFYPETGELTFKGNLVGGEQYEIPKEILEKTVIPKLVIKALSEKTVLSSDVDYSGKFVVGDKDSEYSLLKLKNFKITPVANKVTFQSTSSKSLVQIPKFSVNLVEEKKNEIVYNVQVEGEGILADVYKDYLSGVVTANAKIRVPEGEKTIKIKKEGGNYYLESDKTLLVAEGAIDKVFPFPVIGDALGFITTTLGNVFGFSIQANTRDPAWISNKLCLSSKNCQKQNSIVIASSEKQ